MPFINVILRGQGSNERTIKSPHLSREEADSHLDQIGKLIGDEETVELPWIRVPGFNIISANLESDPPPDMAG